jgi:type VI secretion system protein ImpJ
MIRNIVWREGLFIKPQHFQQNSFYMMSELMQRTRSSAANMWGLFELEIDKSNLSLGKVLIRHVSGLMPEGTLLDINGQ